MRQPYPTNDQIDAAALELLTQQPCGKDPKQRPKAADAYQLAVEMEERFPHIADPIVAEADFGGVGAGKNGPVTLTQAIQFSMQRLKRRGLIRVRYKSTRHMGVYRTKTNEWIRPSYDVCGEYELKGSRQESDENGWHD